MRWKWILGCSAASSQGGGRNRRGGSLWDRCYRTSCPLRMLGGKTKDSRLLCQGLPSKPASLPHACSTADPASLDRSLPAGSSDRTLRALKAIGLVGCAREGMLSSDSNFLCTICDNRMDHSGPTEPPSVSVAGRIFTRTPLEGMRISAPAILDSSTDLRIKLAFLQATSRLLQHSRTDTAAMDLERDEFAQLVVRQLAVTTRSIRIAAGYVQSPAGILRAISLMIQV